MKIGFRLASVLLVLSLFGSTRALAESVTFYKIDEAPGLLSGVLMKGGQIQQDGAPKEGQEKLHAISRWASLRTVRPASR